MDEPVLMTPFISFTDLLKIGWDNVKRNIKNIIKMILVSVGVIFVIILIAGILGFVAISSQSPAIKTAIEGGNWQSLLSVFSPGVVMGMIGGFVLFVLVATILSVLMQITQVKIYSAIESKSIWHYFKTSFPLILPMIGLSFLIQFLSFGGMFVFFVPGVIIAIYLSLAAFELIISNKKIIPAMVGSYQIISQHFGDIFLRYLALYIPYFIIFGIIPEILSESDSLILSTINLVLVIAGNLFTIFTVAYAVELYKEASRKTDYSKTVSLTWIWIVAIIGWIIAGFGSYLVIKYALPEAKSAITEELSQNKETEKPNLVYTSSGCGLSIPVPTTTDTYKTKERKWIFEEIPMDESNFYMLDNDVYPHPVVLGSFLGYKESDMRLGGRSFEVGYPGINVYCIDNTKELSLDEYISAVQTGKSITAEVKNTISFDGLDFQLVKFSGLDERKQEFTDNVYLGVSEDNSRLIAIRVWNAEGDEMYKDIASTLGDDITIILDNIKSRNISSKVTDLAKPQL